MGAKKTKKETTNDDLKNLIDALAVSTLNSFEEIQKFNAVLENRIGGVEMGVAKANQKLEGLHSRIDDIANNRVRNDIFESFSKRFGIVGKKVNLKTRK
ncbi:MAG: hypothetical protein AAB488_01505 [Patescibacteria group bacterium]